MKWKCLFENKQLTILTLGMAGLMAGCCTKSAGGSYSSASYSTEGSAYANAPEPQESAANQQVLPLYKEQLNVGTRQVDDGTVRIRKVVKTETVNEPIQLRTESVVIDRQPAATGQQPEGQPFQDQELTIQLHHDEPVISKQIVPTGQIVAQTRSDVQQQNVQEQVRRETVDIDKGNAQNVTISDNVKHYENESEPMGGTADVSGQSSAEASGPITDVNTLCAHDANSLNGRQVQLSNAKVDRIKGQTLVIKDNSGKECFVRLSQPADNIHPGDQVNITGTVQLSPTSSEADEQIPQGKVCIQAQTVQPAQ